MAIEIERKFLVFKDLLPPLKDGGHYIQGYLSLDPQVRYRMIGSEVIIAIKTSEKGSVGRNEWEFTNTLDETERQKLKALAIRKPIEKIRYKIPYEGLIWEIDVYQGENDGLISAEVELPTPDYPIVFPSWIDKDSEIGNNPKYRNSNLGEHPYKDWK
jgi:CYTH domain-containing protein